jgi:glycosyltransferase involved in cell wall biosynthesis
MKISIISITYKNLSGLQRTVKSVMSQNYEDVEFIIVDGESDDGTADFLATIGDRAKIITSEAKGVYNAINQGLKASTGDLVGILNAGDVYTSDDVISTVAKAFEKNEDVSYLYGDIHFFNEHTLRISRYYSGADCSLKSMRRGFAPPHPTLFMRRQLMQKIGLYDESFRIAGDFEMFMRLFSDDKIKRLYLPLDMIEMAPGGISSWWRNRLYTNNVERMRALRMHGVKASLLRILTHYYYILNSSICRRKRNKKHISA